MRSMCLDGENGLCLIEAVDSGFYVVDALLHWDGRSEEIAYIKMVHPFLEAMGGETLINLNEK